MSEQQKTIASLWPIARALGQHLQEWHVPERGGDPKWFSPVHWNGHDYMSAGFASPGTIEYRVNEHADIRIQDIDVAGVKPEDVYVGPIEPTGDQRVVKSEVIGNRNETLNDVDWKLTHRDLVAQTMADKVAKEVGASLSVGLRQQIGYGSEIAQISGETEITVNMEASVRAAWEREMSQTRESEVTGERDIVIQALHRGVMERVETVGPARQVIRAKGALKFAIRFHSSGNHHLTFDSVDRLISFLGGFEVTTGVVDNHGGFPHDWLQYYRRNPVPDAKLNVFRQTVYAESEKVREFEEASNIDVVLRSDPLNDHAKRLDALRLIQLQRDSFSDEFVSLAAGELARLSE